MVGPPSEVVVCFGAMELWIQWLRMESPPLRVGIINLKEAPAERGVKFGAAAHSVLSHQRDLFCA